jgi:hypothetical protein
MFDRGAQAVDPATEIDRIAMQMHREWGIQREHGSAASVWISITQSLVLCALQCSTTPLGDSTRNAGALAAICTAANGERIGVVASPVALSCWALARNAVRAANKATSHARAHIPLSTFPALVPPPHALANVLRLPSSSLAPFVEKRAASAIRRNEGRMEFIERLPFSRTPGKKERYANAVRRHVP